MFTRQKIRQLRRDNLIWPVKLVEIPIEEWPDEVRKSAHGSTLVRVWRSRDFLVQQFDERGMRRLSVHRTDFDERSDNFRDGISWDDLQRLKSEAGFGDQMAVEIYPPDDEVVNVANVRHLWIMDQWLPCMWTKKEIG